MFCTDPRTAGEKWCFWQISKQSKGVFTKLSVECDGAQVRVVRLTQGKVQLPTRGGAAPPWDRGADGVGGSSHGAHLGVPAGRCRAARRRPWGSRCRQRLWLGEGVGAAAAKAAARSDSGGLDVLEFWAGVLRRVLPAGGAARARGAGCGSEKELWEQLSLARDMGVLTPEDEEAAAVLPAQGGDCTLLSVSREDHGCLWSCQWSMVGQHRNVMLQQRACRDVRSLWCAWGCSAGLTQFRDA
jgi:hypothetical protein